MLTYTDIIRKTLSGVPDPGSMPVWDPGSDFLTWGNNKDYSGLFAWIHPDKSSILFMTLDELNHAGIQPEKISPAYWLSIQLRSSLLIEREALISEKPILGGKIRKIWKNTTKNVSYITNNFVLDNKYLTRYMYKGSLIYQAMDRPHGFFFTTQEGRPYAYVMPVRINAERKGDKV